jgi:hypothetical protein
MPEVFQIGPPIQRCPVQTPIGIIIQSGLVSQIALTNLPTNLQARENFRISLRSEFSLRRAQQELGTAGALHSSAQPRENTCRHSTQRGLVIRKETPQLLLRGQCTARFLLRKEDFDVSVA